MVPRYSKCKTNLNHIYWTREIKPLYSISQFSQFGCSGSNDITQRLKVVPSLVTSYDIAEDYFQALRHINVPTAAPMVRQQSSLIITPV